MTRKWLAEIRESKGFTHEAVASSSGIKRAYYTQIESGSRRPSVEIAQQIAKTLGFEWTLFFEQKCSDSRHQPA